MAIEQAAVSPALIITGTIAKGGMFTGTFDVKRFAVVNDHIAAIGHLSGTLTDESGNEMGTVTGQSTSLTVTPGAVSCENSSCI